jgi:hypothetical protein
VLEIQAFSHNNLNLGSYARQALYHLSHSTTLVFVLGIFKTGSGELLGPSLLGTLILLISASWVAWITGVNYRHQAQFEFLKGNSVHERLRSGGWWFEASPGKKFSKLNLQNNQSKVNQRLK